MCSFTHYTDHQRVQVHVIIDQKNKFNKFRNIDISGMRILRLLDSGNRTFQAPKRLKNIVKKRRKRMLRRPDKLLKKQLEGTDVGRRRVQLHSRRRRLWVIRTIYRGTAFRIVVAGRIDCMISYSCYNTKFARYKYWQSLLLVHIFLKYPPVATSGVSEDSRHLLVVFLLRGNSTTLSVYKISVNDTRTLYRQI